MNLMEIILEIKILNNQQIHIFNEKCARNVEFSKKNPHFLFLYQL